MATVIEARELSKRFVLRHNRSGSIKERFLGLLHSSHRERSKNSGRSATSRSRSKRVNRLASSGRNGSGKSTFLRLVAGIHRPTSTAGSPYAAQRASER